MTDYARRSLTRHSSTMLLSARPIDMGVLPSLPFKEMEAFRMELKTLKLIVAISLLSSGSAIGGPNGPLASYSCVPFEVAQDATKVYVRCEHGYKDKGGLEITHFAVPLSHVNTANRFLQLGATSMTTGIPMYFNFVEGNYSANSFGCKGYWCRKPVLFSLRKLIK